MTAKKRSRSDADHGPGAFPPGFALRHTLRGKGGVISQIAWSPDGRAIASGHDDSVVRCWDAAAGRMLRTFEIHPSAVYTLAWSPNGRLLASGSGDKFLVWDTLREEAASLLEVNGGGTFGLAWSPDGRALASGSRDHTI